MSQNRIAYFTWPPNEISGGIKLIFRHVEMLNRAGINAVVVEQSGLSPNWCKSSAEVIDISQVIEKDDILVFPENNAELLRKYATWPNKKVIYCQNHFMANCGLAGAPCYSDFGVSGILSLGTLATDFCEQRFPKLPVFGVPGYVNRSLFQLVNEKTLQIAYAPRKRSLEATFIRDLFCSSHPSWRSIPWVQIDANTENEVAEQLGQSAIYLSLQRLESVGLSALEAMACGCLVAGFTGQGGREYANAKNGYWVEEDDCLACVVALANAVACAYKGGQTFHDKLESGYQTASGYSEKRLTERIVTFWKDFLKSSQWPFPNAT